MRWFQSLTAVAFGIAAALLSGCGRSGSTVTSPESPADLPPDNGQQAVDAAAPVFPQPDEELLCYYGPPPGLAGPERADLDTPEMQDGQTDPAENDAAAIEKEIRRLQDDDSSDDIGELKKIPTPAPIVALYGVRMDR